jgi:membrane associated rhomboid family serine protease
MTPTSVGMRCPECSKQRTQARGIATTVTQPILTYVLMGICIALALGTVFGGYSASGSTSGGSRLFEEAALSRGTVADGELWRLVTAGFLHGGLLHLFFNMFALYILGGLLEPAIGRLRFALVYFVSLLAGSFGALLLQPTGVTVGASGAIFGLMGAAFLVMRHRGIDPMESGLGLWIGLNLLITFTIPNISIGGHLGGLAGGAIVALLLFELPDRLGMPRQVPALLATAVGAVSVAGSVAVAG